MKQETFDSDYAVYVEGNYRQVNEACLAGTFKSPFGLVGVERYTSRPCIGQCIDGPIVDESYCLFLSMIVNNRHYRRQIQRQEIFTQRSMSILAGKFAHDVINKLES